MDCSPPGSSVHGIFQARILEWVVISYFRGSFQPRDWTCICCLSCIDRQIYHSDTRYWILIWSLYSSLFISSFSFSDLGMKHFLWVCVCVCVCVYVYVCIYKLLSNWIGAGIELFFFLWKNVSLVWIAFSEPSFILGNIVFGSKRIAWNIVKYSNNHNIYILCSEMAMILTHGIFSNSFVWVGKKIP